MIGAGMVGAACALRLQAGGMAVKLVDPGDQRRGASFGNAGHIAVEQVSPWSSWNVNSISIIYSKEYIFRNAIHQIRKSINGQIKRFHSAKTAALLLRLLLFDRPEIKYQTKNQFINAGAVHVLAVSGLHVGYIILIFLFLFGRLNFILRSILTIVGLLCFMFLTGVPPSVFRATVMSVVFIVAFLSNRSTNLFNSISIAALIILLINPNEIYNPGFQLSFTAVLAIAIILPYINKMIEHWNIQNKVIKNILLFFGVSISAQIGTLPFTLLYFNKFSIIGVFANLLVIPAIGVIIAAAISTLVISVVIPFVAIYLGEATSLISEWMLRLIKFGEVLRPKKGGREISGGGKPR